MGTILITGANRGIGAALREHAMAQGHEVTGTARAPRGGPPEWLTLDVTDPGAFAPAKAAFGDGPLDVLVCNAGVFVDRGSRIETITAEEMAESFAVNVTGVALTIQAFLPNLMRAEGAKIAVISSQMGSSAQASGTALAYRTSKAAAANLARNLSSALRPHGIAVTAYHPGWVRTEMGGASAAIGVEESARGLWARIDALTPETGGRLETWAGERMPF